MISLPISIFLETIKSASLWFSSSESKNESALLLYLFRKELTYDRTLNLPYFFDKKPLKANIFEPSLYSKAESISP